MIIELILTFAIVSAFAGVMVLFHRWKYRQESLRRRVEHLDRQRLSDDD